MQLAKTGSNRLPLIASLGFTEDMKREMNLLGRDHQFSREIVGLGRKIVIRRLNPDGKYNISIFKESGFKSLLAVPIMTYRIHGILGMAFRSRMKFNKDFTQLTDVIASLIGMSLHKSSLNELEIPKSPNELTSSEKEKSGDDKIEELGVKAPLENDMQTIHGTTVAQKDQDISFHDHDRSMRLFSESHK